MTRTARFETAVCVVAMLFVGAIAAHAAETLKEPPTVTETPLTLKGAPAQTAKAAPAPAGEAIVITLKESVPEDWPMKEEPALRPWKALFRGVGSIAYQTWWSFTEGNEKLPFIGSVEAFRGLRRGTVELAEGTYRGMAGTYPEDFRKLGKLNRFIDDDPCLRNVADTFGAYPVYHSYSWSEKALVAGGVVFAAQKATDYSPVDPNRDQRDYERSVRKAQREYIGARADVNTKHNDTGNLVNKYGK